MKSYWRYSSFVVHLGTFSPPEWIIRSEFIAEPSSVWGLAVLLYSLLCGRVPFYDSGEIVEGRLHFPRYLSEGEETQRHYIQTCTLSWKMSTQNGLNYDKKLDTIPE